VSDWKADPTRPGVYTATVKSLVPGMYALTANAARLGGYPVPGDQSRTPVNASPLMAQFMPPVHSEPVLSPVATEPGSGSAPGNSSAPVGGRSWLVGLVTLLLAVMRRI